MHVINYFELNVYLECKQRVINLHSSESTETVSKTMYQNQRNVKIFSLITLSAMTPKSLKIQMMIQMSIKKPSFATHTTHHASVSSPKLRIYENGTL